MKKVLISSLILTLFFTLSACTKTEALTDSINDKDTLSVDTITVSEKKHEKETKYPGLLKTETKLTVRAEVAGKVLDVFAKAGDKVSLSQDLAALGNENGEHELGISVKNTENLYKLTNTSLINLQNTNLESVKNTEINLKNAELNLTKARQYYADLVKTYETEREKMRDQVERLQILANIANFNYENYLKKSEIEKLQSLNQIAQTDDQNELVRTQINNTKDVNDELLDQAERNLENAEIALDYAEDYLEGLQNNNASPEAITAAREAVSNARAQYELIKSQIVEIEASNDATIDNLRKQLSSGYTRLEGSEIQNNSYLIDIETKLKNLEFERDLADRNLKEAKTGLALLENQQKQNMNNVLNDIAIAELNVSNLKSGLELAKNQSKLKESEALIKLTEIQGNLELLKSQNDKRVIKSFLEGIISKKFVEKGTVVNTGSELFEIVDDQNFSVEWYVSESDVSDLKLGTEVMVVFEKIKMPIVAKVTTIDPSSGKYSKKVRVEAVLSEKKAEMKDNAYVEIIMKKEDIKTYPVIPLSAIKTVYKDNFVFLLVEGKAILTPIKVFETLASEVVIEDGVKAGDIIINNPSKLLQDGMTVTPKNE